MTIRPVCIRNRAASGVVGQWRRLARVCQPAGESLPRSALPTPGTAQTSQRPPRLATRQPLDRPRLDPGRAMNGFGLSRRVRHTWPSTALRGRPWCELALPPCAATSPTESATGRGGSRHPKVTVTHSVGDIPGRLTATRVARGADRRLDRAQQRPARIRSVRRLSGRVVFHVKQQPCK